MTFFESQCLFICDQISLEILDLNEVAVKRLGYSREDIIGKKITKLARPISRSALDIDFKNPFQNKEDIWVFTTKTSEKMVVQFTSHMINYAERPAKFVVAHYLNTKGNKSFSDPIISSKLGITNFPLAEIEWTPDLKVVRWSKKAEELFGWSEQEAISSDTLLVDFVYPDDLELVRNNLENTLSNKQLDLSIINRNITKQGKVIHCEWYNSLLYNSKGELSSVYSLVHDVTNRIEAREKLTRSMKSYLDLFNSINEAIYLLNKDGEILEVNDGVKFVFGYEPDEVLGKNYRVLGAPGKFDPGRLQKLIRNSTDRKNIKYEGWGRKKNGEVFPTEFSANPGTYFGQDVLIIIESDVSERKQAEENLKHREELFSELFKSSPIGIALLNNHKEVEMINDGFEHIFGYSEPEIKGLELDKVIVPEDEYEKAQVFSSTVKVSHFTGKRKTKDNRLIDVLIYAVPVIVDGKVIALYGIYVDITERKQTEEEIKKSLREKEVLLAEIHHRVKNNLAVITGLLELQSYNTKNNDARMVLRNSQMRVNSIALVHEKLYQNENLSRIDIHNYIEELSSVIQNTISTEIRDVKLHLDLDPIELAITQAIPCGLLLNEILTNSYKHAFEGESKGKIWISFKEIHDELVYTIKDNGRGLSAEDIPKGKTSSLGMKLIQTLGKQLNAKTSITSEEGARFEFRFKRASNPTFMINNSS